MSDAPTRAETRDSETVPASEGVDGEAVGEASVTPYEDAASPQTPKATAPIMSGAPDMKTGAQPPKASDPSGQPQEEGPLAGSAETHAEYIRRHLDEGRPHFLAGLGFQAQSDDALFQGCYLVGKILARTMIDETAGTALDELCDKLNARGDSRGAKLIDLMSRSADGKSTVHRRKMTVYTGAAFWFAWNPDDQPDAVASQPALPCPSGDRETAIAAARATGGIDDINELYRIWALEHFEPGSGKLGALSKNAARKAGSPAAAKQAAQNKAADRKASRLANAAARTERAALAKTLSDQSGFGPAVCRVCGRGGLQFTSLGNVRPHHAHGGPPGAVCPGGGNPPAEKTVTPRASASASQGETVSSSVPPATPKFLRPTDAPAVRETAGEALTSPSATALQSTDGDSLPDIRESLVTLWATTNDDDSDRVRPYADGTSYRLALVQIGEGDGGDVPGPVWIELFAVSEPLSQAWFEQHIDTSGDCAEFIRDEGAEDAA